MDTRRVALVVAIAVLMAAMFPIAQYDGDSGTDVLIDDGDGNTEWYEASGSTVADALASATASAGRDLTINGGAITVDGVSSVTTGSSATGGSFEKSGTTGVTSVCLWQAYGWDGDAWTVVDTGDSASSYSALALGFYPEGAVPAESPDWRNTWTMFRGDAQNSGAQEAEYSSTTEYEVDWYDVGYAYSNPLYAGGYVFQKYGLSASGTYAGYAAVVCFDLATGDTVWSFTFESGANYELSTPLIVGDYIYIATMTGYIYKIPWAEGPGDDCENVTSYGGVPWTEAEAAPTVLDGVVFDEGTTYDSGFSSMVCYAGAIYVNHSNGMVYCFDLDLNLLWSCLLDAHTYFLAPTVYDGYVFTSSLNGHMYVIDAADGGTFVNEIVYQVTIRDKIYGGLGQIAVFDNDDGTYSLIFTVTDGRGMSQSNSGLAVYTFDSSSDSVEKVYLSDELGIFGRYVSPVESDGFRGAYVTVSDGSYTSLIRISVDGQIETIVEGLSEIHSAGTVVNGEYIYLVSYASYNPIYQISLTEGRIVATANCASQVRNYNMSSLLVLGDTVIGSTDSGVYSLTGTFIEYVEPDDTVGAPIIVYLALIVLLIALALFAVWAALRYGRHVEKPFKYLKDTALHYLYGENLSHNTRNRHRLKFVIVLGVILIFVVFTLCLCVGSTQILSPVEAYSALFSAIAKGGVGLDVTETLVFVSRLPRTIAALAVGIGLSMAGCVYQAIIRNPLVDPYIMGVSSGAGIAAIAVIAFDFTFFGVFSSHSIFLTAVSAIIGGLIAFAATMLIAEKAGGSSINYVLAGVVVGLACSAMQTIMLTMAGNKLSNALTWLYGSFAEVTWSQVGVIIILSVALSLVPMIWAKEFNLVLLGEDRAREMGLDVRRFNRLMLILASVLTSVCVAFCGIIGFVGLVIPHLCRMLLGSDHRMVMPASFLFGGVMLMLADLLSRTGYYGIELPVGAITTVIGVPVFAYLLIKKGRIYDG